MLLKTAFVVCLAFAISANQQLWNEFKEKHSETYATETEQQMRYAIFTSNLETIEEHNARYEQGLVSWFMSVNQFSDLTPEEFRQRLTAQTVNYTKPSYDKVHVSSLDIPASIDWRSLGAVTGVKHQGSCGSCWAFSATGTLEGQFFLKKGYLQSLSEQNIVDCCTNGAGYHGSGCSGGIVQSALDYVRDHGIATESNYRYKAVQESCKSAGNVFQTTGYTRIAANDENSLKNAVGTVGPVSVALNAAKFQSYGGGIFSDTSCSTSINHAVLAVGYGNSNGQDYWLVKNSWGANWGEKGYIRMEIGHNLCAIASQACYPNA